MCTYIGSDVVLANLLYYSKEKNGVTFSDIENYCQRIKSAIAKLDTSHTQFVSFQINDASLAGDLKTYPKLFKHFSGKYYMGSELNTNNIRQFKYRLSPEMNEIMRREAEKI